VGRIRFLLLLADIGQRLWRRRRKEVRKLWGRHIQTLDGSSLAVSMPMLIEINKIHATPNISDIKCSINNPRSFFHQCF
jgi:hypothetical protein